MKNKLWSYATAGLMVVLTGCESTTGDKKEEKKEEKPPPRSE